MAKLIKRFKALATRVSKCWEKFQVYTDLPAYLNAMLSHNSDERDPEN